MRVLVVEANADILDFLKAVLEGYGGSVSIVASAKEALQALAYGQHDVLVCDIGLPDQDGYELIRQIRRLLVPKTTSRLPTAPVEAYRSGAVGPCYRASSQNSTGR